MCLHPEGYVSLVEEKDYKVIDIYTTDVVQFCAEDRNDGDLFKIGPMGERGVLRL